MDHILIARLRWSPKYEAVHVHDLTDGIPAQRVIGEWNCFYNTVRLDSTLAGPTPTELAEQSGPWI